MILPVYNAEHYLKKAIDSVLQQTFADFELIIVNDGSVDRSEQIILSYDDSRIVYVRNKRNEGLIASLNKAIDMAKGEYIARMDADDIALPQRFEKQINHLQTSGCAILATRVTLIDGEGNSLPDWKDDAENLKPSQIKRFLVKDNCIAHPTVMGKAVVFKKYKYRYYQKYSEDYDLWLRLINDGLSIHKLAEPLLLYRQLPTSATRFKKINIFLRLAKVKTLFSVHELKNGKLTVYVLNALMHASFDIIKALGKEIKLLLKK